MIASWVICNNCGASNGRHFDILHMLSKRYCGFCSSRNMRVVKDLPEDIEDFCLSPDTYQDLRRKNFINRARKVNHCLIK